MWLLKGNDKNKDVVLERPWVEVISASLSEIDGSGAALKELQTGDELADGAILKTDNFGQAIIHFPDGSEARLEPNTTVTITNASYSEENGSLVVRIALSTGRIWSKVISLSTPESEWRVDTANAVATVRGTAFGSEVIEGNSNFIGSENTVLVKAKNPDTGEEVEDTETPLTEDDVIELPKKDIQRILAAKSALAKKKIDAEAREDFKEWIGEQREKDNVLQNRLEELEEQGLTPEEAKAELRQEIRQNFIEQIIERRELLQEENAAGDGETIEGNSDTSFISRILIPQLREKIVEALIAKGEREAALKVKALSDAEISALLKRFFNGDFSQILSNQNNFQQIMESLIKEYDAPQSLPVNQTEPAVSGSISAAKVSAIKITSDVSLTAPIVEGRDVRLKAVATMSDGTTLDVTSKAKWQVIGPIGTVATAGVFTPRLSPDVAELGESFGSVTAVFEDASGAIFLGKTPIFKVVPETPISGEQAG